MKWYRLAAEQGNAEYQFKLGLMYGAGQGVPQDYDKAVKWFRLAAEQGKVEAQVGLGLMYESGTSVPQDYAEAHMWYNLAAARGSELGRKNRDIVAKKMTPTQIAEAQRLAREWLEKHGE